MVASRGRLQKEPWIKPYSVCPDVTTDSAAKSTYTAVLIRDVAFRPLERSILPLGVTSPRSGSCKIFVFDVNLAGAVFSKSGAQCVSDKFQRFGRMRDSGSRKKRKERQESALNGEEIPPPVPPKPNNLYKGRFEVVPPKLKPRKADPMTAALVRNAPPSKLPETHHRFIPNKGEAILLPRRKLKVGNSILKRSSSAKLELSKRDSTPSNVSTSTKEAVLPPIVTCHSDTEIQMNYNISLCSSGTLTYDRCLDNDEENSYESVDPISPRSSRKMATSPRSPAIVVNSPPVLPPRYGRQTGEDEYGMYSEPYELTSVRMIAARKAAELSRSSCSLKEHVGVSGTYAGNKSESSVSLSQTSTVSSENPLGAKHHH